jgi:hypothetical protein
MDDLRIQIVNYRTKQCLVECIASILRNLGGSPITFKIAVLDNASGDDLSDLTNLFPSAPLAVAKSSHNIGFGAGHNLLAKKAEGIARHLLVLNPDVIIQESDTLPRLLKKAERLSADVIGPRLMTTAHETQWYDHGELHGLLARIALGAGGSYWKDRHVPAEAAWVSGAFFLIRKNLFDEIGGFDENFFLYKEEEDLCLRIRKAGGHIWYDPDITVLHYGSVVAKKSKYMRKSANYFLEKHFHESFLYRPLRILNHLIW